MVTHKTPEARAAARVLSNRVRSLRWRNKNIEKARALFRDWYARSLPKRLKKYGLTWGQYTDLLVTQQFRCRVCNRHWCEVKKGLVVDHNHSTGKVRGLLCAPCNLGLGLFKDSPTLLASAALYAEALPW